jgi:4-alpha-glucanotransferase
MNQMNLNNNNLSNNRMGGILVHPTSFPSKYGIGDLGPELYKFINFLHQYKLNLWQILPLGPTGYANSPYQSFSAFAGNSMLISPEKLIEMKLLSSKECKPVESFPDSRVDFGKVIKYKWSVLETAFNHFQNGNVPSIDQEFNSFIKAESFWLDDFSIFMSIKLANELKAWNEWKDDLRFHNPVAIKQWKEDFEFEIKFHKFTQFLFFKQWKEAKNYANQKSIKIIGDLPIFVAYDSVDVWIHPEFYQLDDNRELLYVSGVPPDYFSSTGQRWGNPLYNWEEMKKQDYKWWIQRIKHSFRMVDILRIDHFRGFESYWQIPASEETAVIGEWKLGPGINLFQKLKQNLGEIPIIAEDLGLITPEVEKLLQQTGYPGILVLQFAFEESQDPSKHKYLPHNYVQNSIVYTGTHDNQTTKSWFDGLSEKKKDKLIDYLNSFEDDMVGILIRLIWGSVANMAVIPLQDLLRLGDEARMNVPGTTNDNWEWRFTWDQFNENYNSKLAHISEIYGRI